MQRQRHPLIDELLRVQERDGLSGSDLARRLQVNPSTITRLMSGDMQPSLRIVQAISSAFPELRSTCAQLLLIGTSNNADEQMPVEAAS